MTANVSFYLIGILAHCVKSHSLQERNILWNVLIVDHHVKKNIIYIHYDSLKGFLTQYQTKTKLKFNWLC